MEEPSVSTHNLPVQCVLLHHDRIDACRVLEGQESEATRPAGRVAHDGTCVHFAKLLKVRAKCFYPTVSTAVYYNKRRALPSVVSQFRPPMNIFLGGGEGGGEGSGAAHTTRTGRRGAYGGEQSIALVSVG